MKFLRMATIKDGAIVETISCSHETEVEENQIPLTSNEYALIRACDGDLELATNIIRDIKSRIAKLEATANHA